MKRASLVGLGILLLGGLAAQEPPDIVRGPYLQSLLERSVRVVWRSEGERRGRVVVRDEAGVERTIEEAAAGVRHDVLVDGLLPHTTYFYEVRDETGALRDDARFTFRTAPPSGAGSLRAVVIGDSGDKALNELDGRQTAVRVLLDDLEPDLFLHVGDLLYTGTYDEVLFDEYERLLARVGIFAARGDHGAPPLDLWFDLFSPPPLVPLDPCTSPAVVCPDGGADVVDFGTRDAVYYSFDWGPVHFAFVDALSDFDMCSQQLFWLCRDLDDAVRRAIPWRVIVVHEHIYTVGAHSISPSKTREIIPAVADAFNVHLVFSGDDHNYQRTHPLRATEVVDAWQNPEFFEPRGTIYVITGGGGTRLYARQQGGPDERRVRVFHMEHHAVEIEADRDRLGVRALRHDGALLDEFSIVRGVRQEPGFALGDIAIDGQVNLADALELLNVLFLNGRIQCVPAFSTTADVNESGEVDLGDVLQLVNVLFFGAGGPDSTIGVCRGFPGLDPESCLAATCKF